MDHVFYQNIRSNETSAFMNSFLKELATWSICRPSLFSWTALVHLAIDTALWTRIYLFRFSCWRSLDHNVWPGLVFFVLFTRISVQGLVVLVLCTRISCLVQK
jgi:hypothetical protein